MKTLLVIANAGFSGAEKQLLMIAEGLSKRDFDVTVCNLEGYGLFYKEFNKTSLDKLVIIKRRHKFDFIRFFNFGYHLSKTKYDIVISFGYVSNNLTRILRVLNPFLGFMHIAGERGRDIKTKNIFNVIDSYLSSYSDVIVSNSKIQKDKLIKVENIKSSLIKVINNGFELSNLENIKPVNFQKEFGIPIGNKVICSIGNLSKHKNIPMFLNVAEKIISSRNDVSFLYVGDGPKLKKYKEEARRLGINSNVLFSGRRDDVLDILAMSDIFILTSSWEGMPNVLIEAMFLKLSVVCTSVDGAKEIITNQINGILVELDDVDEMIDKIYLLLDNEELNVKIGENAYNLAKSLFNSETMIDSYIQLIKHKMLK